MDSDDEIPIVKKEPFFRTTIPQNVPSESSNQVVKVEQNILASEKTKLRTEDASSSSTTVVSPVVFEIDESAKDQSGKYILSKKAKVEEVMVLSEVPKRWPVPPKNTSVAYVINLDEEKRWREAAGKKNINRFLKQEVFYTYHQQNFKLT